MTHNMPTAEPVKKFKAAPWLIAGAVVLIGLSGLGCATSGAGDTPALSDGKPIATSGADLGKRAGSADKPAAGHTYHTPTPADFVLTVKVRDKQCFGSAGCNVEYRIEAACAMCADLDPSQTYDVTYEVKGGGDPQISTLTVQGGEFEQDRFQYISTPSSKSVLTAVVTSVSPA